MPGLRDERSRGRVVVTATIVAALAVSLSVGGALAKEISGDGGGEKLTGGKRADTIKGKGGPDRIKGKAGNDVLDGGGGNDTLIGGRGKDTHRGGGGNDTIESGDNRRDRKVLAGAGIDTCNIDTTLELTGARGCETVTNSSGISDRGPGPGQGLRVGIADGLGCSKAQSTCSFNIQGDGADALGGDVTGTQRVSSVTGVALAIVPPENDDWIATGSYRCTGFGFLRVTVGAESVDVPVSC